jgi:hypothetical protein
MQAFPHTLDKVKGAFYPAKKGRPKQHKGGFDLNISEFLKDRSERFIRLDGACSQNYARDYAKYHDKLLEWCEPNRRPKRCREGEVHVHVRLKDYVRRGYNLSDGYYENLLDSMDFDVLTLVTDDPMSEKLNVFKRWPTQITSLDEISDFQLLLSARRLVMSASTFSWWAAFLNTEAEVWFPLPKRGYWSPTEFPFIDLRVADERYHWVLEE